MFGKCLVNHTIYFMYNFFFFFFLLREKRANHKGLGKYTNLTQVKLVCHAISEYYIILLETSLLGLWHSCNLIYSMEIQLREELTACELIALHVQNKTTFKKFVLFRAGFVVNKHSMFGW